MINLLVLKATTYGHSAAEAFAHDSTEGLLQAIAGREQSCIRAEPHEMSRELRMQSHERRGDSSMT